MKTVVTGKPQKRSRPVAPKPKPFPIVRVLLVVAVVGGLVLAAGGYGMWRTGNAQPEWRTHESAGGFSVELPAAPRNDVAIRTGLPPLRNLTTEGTSRRNSTYVISCGDLQGRHDWSTDEQVLGEVTRGMKAELSRDRCSEPRALTVDGFLAHEMTFTVAGEGDYVVRVVLVDTRVFAIVAGGPAGGADADARRFFDSFRVTDESAKAAHQRRREAAAQRLREGEERRLAAIRELEEAQQRAEEFRRREAEAARLRDEEERRQREAAIEAERKRRAEVEAEADKFRAAQVGVSAPDPTKLPGLKLYLSFDDAKERVIPVWPKEQIEVKTDLDTGAGVRGRALYFSKQAPAISVPTRLLPAEVLRGPGTVTGWVKARKPFGLDLVRTTSTKGTVYDLSRVGLIRQASGRFAAYAWVPVPDTHWRDKFPGEAYSNGISGACPDDELWHHVALVRYGDTDRDRVVLYVDGEAVAEHRFPGADPGLKELFFGFGTANQFQIDRDKLLRDLDMPVAALDELCLFGRALRPEDVKYLAGKGQAPAPPVVPPVVPPAAAVKVQLKEFTKLKPLAGVAFDLERNVVWAVGSPRSHWGNPPGIREELSREPTYLLKYSYPEFLLEDKWPLPRYEDRRGNKLAPDAGPPALDVKNNRLYLLLSYPSSHSESLREPYFGYGEFHRFDLDKLSETTKPGETLKAAAKMKARGAGSQIGPAVVSADGEWLYFVEPSGKLAYDGSVTRMPPDLSKMEPISVPGSSVWAQGLWLSPDGAILRVVQGGKAGRGSGTAESGILEVDTKNWKAGAVRDIRGVAWTREDAPNRDSWPGPVAIHPDGRGFAVTRGGAVETIRTGDQVVTRTRPGPRVPSAFLAVSADGRFLIAADKSGINSLVVFDARPNPPTLEPLASMDGSIDCRAGGPFFVSPDGQFVVFRSGLVVRVDDGSVVARKKKAPTAPMPRERPPAAK